MEIIKFMLTAIANAVACGLTTEEISLLSGVLVQLGDTLATIAAVRSITSGS